MPNDVNILTEAHSYANRENAVKKVMSCIANGRFDYPVRWVILAQPDGRFTPAVCLASDQVHDLHYFINNKVAVIG